MAKLHEIKLLAKSGIIAQTNLYAF